MQMELSYVFAVVITGLVVVFLGLILLIAFISIIGKIFASIDKKKKSAVKTVSEASSKADAPAKAAAPTVQVSEDDEIIAVISAAVAMMGEAEGKAYRLKSVKAAAGNSSSRNAWAAAGLRESTNPF